MIQTVIEWLSVRLTARPSPIMFARLFGSIAKGSHSPSDCDILLVSDAGPESLEWRNLRIRINELNSEFREHFGIPLSITLMTAAEFTSLADFVETLTPSADFLVRR